MDENKELLDQELDHSEAKEGTAEALPEAPVVDLTPEPTMPDDISGEYHPKEEERTDVLFKPVEYVDDSSHSIDEELEKVRKSYAKKLTSASAVNIVSMVLLVLALVSVILTSFLNQDEGMAWLTWTVFGIAMAIILASFGLSTVLTRRSRKTNVEYLGKYQEVLSGYIAQKLDVQEPIFSVEALIPNEEVIQAHYFKTIMDTRSRCVLKGERKGRPFLTGELYILIPEIGLDHAIERPTKDYTLEGEEYHPEQDQTLTSTQEIPGDDMTVVDHDLAAEIHGAQKERKDRRLDPTSETTRTGFFGRYYSYRMRVDSKESFLLSYIGKRGECVLPDYVDSYVSCHIPGLRRDIICYLADPQSSSKFFTPDTIALLNDIHLDSTIHSLFLSVNSYGSKIGMNLSDEVMELPLKNSVHEGAIDDFVDLSRKAFAFLDAIEPTCSLLSEEEGRAAEEVPLDESLPSEAATSAANAPANEEAQTHEEDR